MATHDWSPARAIGIGTLAVGVLDALDAIVFFGLRGVRASRIFQGIASGLLGKASFQGGAAALRQRPLVYGLPYGLAAYFVMNLVVIPLSAIGRASFSPAPFLNGLLIHGLVIGPISAWVASRVPERRR
jgi:hypothetical protein